MSTKLPKTKPTPNQIAKAEAAAADKAKKAADQIKQDQTWLDKTTPDLTDDDRDELFRQVSKSCEATSKDGDNIVTACPVPRKLVYCVDADPFECPNGKVEGKVGCKLSDEASHALTQKNEAGENTVCIDGAFVSKLEGGSYLSPYVPWGPLGGKKGDASPTLTTRNSSGVTIGTGVDLGAISDADKYLKRLEAAGVSEETRDKLKPLLGKKKAAACKALREAKGDGTMVLPSKDVELIDVDAFKQRVPALKKAVNGAAEQRIKMLNGFIKKENAKPAGSAKSAAVTEWQKQIEDTNSFEDLPCSQQSILFSTLYHEGSLGSDHSQSFLKAVISGDDAAALAALTAKSKDATSSLIAARGKGELAYWGANGGD